MAIPQGEDFFTDQSIASKIKAAIVFKYFCAWANIIGSISPEKIGYLDFFSGPGKYQDGNDSTPILILKEAIRVPKIRQTLVTMFQDANDAYVKELKLNVGQIPNIDQLKFAPYIEANKVGEGVTKKLKEISLIPSLIFIDPFGYNGLSLELLGSAIKDWGCDCIFFFNYNRINAAINNPVFTNNVNLIFGKEIADKLRQDVEGKSADERQKLIMDRLAEALNSVNGKFKVEFKFYQEDSKKTSHYVVLVTKHQKGYEVMKETMATLSDLVDGVPTYEYQPKKKPPITGDLFAKKTSKIIELAEELTVKFAGQALKVKDVYHKHNVGTPYILSNYKKALMHLESENRIVVDKPAAQRPIRKGELTLGDDRIVTFKK
ncbi:three-Cys-motif partner protein TcmP [Chitinophaga polysaccharea]|uniref:three-Cys-motif partner protein TcmP n=1 Tax=Chitinophaga polysaccharea TaxID=1293035 RepID=UPI001454FA4D|nr:three-Cys-motif partner protein TcmP [Chitinophaga polysaccharea]NLR58152.1 three-Cys-motif partner protein TcmP [Chitinophaga polysaccharea]